MDIAFDRDKPLGERNKALAQLSKIYNLENININANITGEQTIKVTIEDDE